MGPKSLRALMELPLEAIDFAAFGGTNFSYLEQLRSVKGHHDNMCLVGHTADEMVENVLDLKRDLGKKAQCTSFIISGGVEDYLQGFYLMQRLGMPSVYGQAKKLLEFAKEGFGPLDQYVGSQVNGLAMAHSFLVAKQ